METRTFGPTGLPIPVVGQGSWNMEKDAAGSVKALRRGIDLGMTHIDTAEMYGEGRVEEIVGKAIAGVRDRVFLASKVVPSNGSYEGVLLACDRSLKRLKTDRLDLYLLHWPGSHPLEGTIRAFEKLVKDGKIRHYGVSNFDVADLEAAVRIAGPGRIACNQVLYHLRGRTIEHAVGPWCAKHRVAIVAYSPFRSGKFPTHEVLNQIAGTHGVTPAQVVLRFLTREPHVFTIPKATKLAHVEENAAFDRVTLGAADLRALEAAFPRGPNRGLPTL